MSKHSAHVRYHFQSRQIPQASPGFRAFPAEQLGWIILSATATGMFYWTWGKWLDVQIDFGRELYIPWQLTEGKVLYRDLAYFNGPVSPYLNALWFSIFGVSLRTLVLCNLAMAVMLAMLLYGFLRNVSGIWAAFWGTELFFLLFVFAHTLAGGNFNYICPYSHEMTHGLLLAMMGIWGIGRYAQSGRWGWVVLSSFAAGLIFLTKVEIALAGIPAIILGLLAAAGCQKNSRWKQMIFVGTIFLLASLAVILIAWGLLARVISGKEALQGVLGSWFYLDNEELLQLPFFHQHMGIQDWQENLRSLGKWTGGYALTLGIAAGIALAIRIRHSWLPAAIGGFVFLTGILALGLNASRISWLDAFRPLPAVILIITAVVFLRWFHHHRQNLADPADAIALSMVILSFLLLFKMILRARIHHYGFGLGLPSVMMGLAGLEWLGGWIHRKGGSRTVFRSGYMAVIAVMVFSYLHIQSDRMDRKTVPITSDSDAFFADVRGVFYNQLLEQIQRQIPPDGTLAVLPEGILFNYLTRRINSTPYFSLIPPDLLMFGENNILNDFSASPPDFIVIVPRNCQEYGVDSFGQGYGFDIRSWIQKNYRETSVINPAGAPTERILILERNSS